jgi:NitT/TauT family transport system substrate-binding protein
MPALIGRLLGFLLLTVVVLAAMPVAVAAERAVVRVGILQFGTVSWELDVMQRHGLAEREGIELRLVPLALKDAANVAIQGGEVDVIANDWIWVSRMRSDGSDYVFAPYSQAVGGISVRPDAGVAQFADLKGKRLGVAGGALDKSWLLLRAYARRTVGEDAATFLRPQFAAPPLLNELVMRGELPAAMNFWHYTARLSAAGMQELITMPQILAGLGIEDELPLVGWVFRERWARDNTAAIDGFMRASAAAKALMLESDAVWEDLRPLMRAENEDTFVALRDGFRAGIPRTTTAEAERVATRVFDILAAEGGEALVGKARAIAPGTFWRGGGGE